MENISFIELKKNCKKNTSGMAEYKLAVLGDCATQHLSTALKGYAFEKNIALDVFDADYNQLDAQTMDSGSELYSFAPNATLIFMCAEKLYEAFCNTPQESRADFAAAMLEKIKGYWQMISSNIRTNILQFSFCENDDKVFGNLAAKVPSSFLFQVKKLNYLLMNESHRFANVYIIDLNGIRSAVGETVFRDEKLYYIAKMPISTEALPAVAGEVIGFILALMGKIKKCAVLDLDNTLWGGVIGDDGMDGIQIGELGLGRAFSELQRWLKELRERGIILAVCSKNDEKTAKEPFEKHPDMVLRLDDISMFVANWEDKASNIKHIRQTLNIGMDSIVFIDDNPFERNLVRELVEGITVPELPEDPAEYLKYLKSLNLFDTASYSDEDKNRTAQYQAEVGRISLKNQFSSFKDYLKGLEMIAEAKPFDKFHYPRIAQLTQRSNQFNLRTVRYTEADIESIADDNEYLTLYFTLKDKFGDHGLISVVILQKRESDLFVNEWLMSCRVLKRGMEEFIVNKMIQTAKVNGFKTVTGEYIKTPKNSMVADIYEKLGFERKDGGIFVADVDNFKFNETFIKE